MICKVQRSLTQGGERMLIYSEDRRAIFHEGPLAGDVAELLGADMKCFVEARLIGKGGWSILHRLPQIEWPTW